MTIYTGMMLFHQPRKRALRQFLKPVRYRVAFCTYARTATAARRVFYTRVDRPPARRGFCDRPAFCSNWR